MTEILVFGAGGHARVVADVIRLAGAFSIHGFIDGSSARYGESFAGSRVLGGQELLDDMLRHGVEQAAVAIGDNEARLRIGRDLAKRGFRLPPLIHPTAVIAGDVVLGSGSLICAGVIINPATTIGDLAIVNTAASVDHDTHIGDAAHIAPGVHMGGHVSVGERSLIGVGAAIKPGVRIGARVTVGVGAAVVRDVADDVTVAGVPARVIR